MNTLWRCGAYRNKPNDILMYKSLKPKNNCGFAIPVAKKHNSFIYLL